MLFKNLARDKKFYKMILLVAVPIMIQNGITNFVSLLDNIMVGVVGTDQMSGVAIANQFVFVFNIAIFGVISGPGIFTAQFFGNNDIEGVRNTFRFKIIACILMVLLAFLVVSLYGQNLISLFLHEGSSTGNIENTLRYGMDYIKIILIGLFPFAISQSYSSTLRETGETILPMKASIAAVLVNLVFDYILIFGKAGFSPLGVKGAAIATVLARFIECFIVVIWTHINNKKNLFIEGALKKILIPTELLTKILLKGSPLMINEALWALGMAALARCYSFGGLAVVAGYNISSTISNLFSIVYIALGNSVSIIIGQLLGAGKMKEAKKQALKLIMFSVVSCSIVAVFMAFLAPIFPMIYNTTEEVRFYARYFILIMALFMPAVAFLNSCYFTIRSGGNTIITFLFDSVFVWIITIPSAYFLIKYAGINIKIVFIVCQSLDLIKCLIGYILVKKGVWLNNII